MQAYFFFIVREEQKMQFKRLIHVCELNRVQLKRRAVRTDLFMFGLGEFIGGIGERRIESVDPAIEVGDSSVLLGEIVPENRRLRFEGRDTCREGNGGYFASNIELFEWI